MGRIHALEKTGKLLGKRDNAHIKFAHAMSRARHAPPYNIKAPGMRLHSFFVTLKTHECMCILINLSPSVLNSLHGCQCEQEMSTCGAF